MDRDRNNDFQGNDVGRENKAAAKIALTEDEIRVLKGCNKDSFYYRCLPLGVSLAGVTHVLVTKGILKPNPRYGSKFKCLGAWFMGYLLGKVSFQGECRERILRLEGSPMAEMIRQSGKYSSSGVAKSQYGDNPNEFSSPTMSAPSLPRRYDDLGDPPSSRPSGTRTDTGPEAPSGIYDELRDQNRQQYQRKHHTAPSRQAPPPQPPPDDSNNAKRDDFEIKENSFKPRVRKNMYGDVIE